MLPQKYWKHTYLAVSYDCNRIRNSLVLSFKAVKKSNTIFASPRAAFGGIPSSHMLHMLQLEYIARVMRAFSTLSLWLIITQMALLLSACRSRNEASYKFCVTPSCWPHTLMGNYPPARKCLILWNFLKGGNVIFTGYRIFWRSIRDAGQNV